MATPRSLQQEIAQSSPFRSLEGESTLGIVRTATLIRRAVARAVKGSGVTLAQYNVLRILRGAGARGLATLSIRDRMVDEAPGITRLIDRLEASGLVRRERSVPDRRQVTCVITAHGLDVLRTLDALVEGSRASWTGGDELTREEQEQLVRLLERVRARLDEALRQER